MLADRLTLDSGQYKRADSFSKYLHPIILKCKTLLLLSPGWDIPFHSSINVHYHAMFDYSEVHDGEVCWFLAVQILVFGTFLDLLSPLHLKLWRRILQLWNFQIWSVIFSGSFWTLRILQLWSCQKVSSSSIHSGFSRISSLWSSIALGSPSMHT